jgi:hypothetical protein
LATIDQITRRKSQKTVIVIVYSIESSCVLFSFCRLSWLLKWCWEVLSPTYFPFNYFFQSREQVVVRRGHIRRIGWVIKTMEAQLGQFLLDCKCPVCRFLPGRAKDLSAPGY